MSDALKANIAWMPAFAGTVAVRFELGTPDSLGARQSQEGSEYFTGEVDGCASPPIR